MRVDELSMKSCDLCNSICAVLRIITCSNLEGMLFVRNKLFARDKAISKK